MTGQKLNISNLLVALSTAFHIMYSPVCAQTTAKRTPFGFSYIPSYFVDEEMAFDNDAYHLNKDTSLFEFGPGGDDIYPCNKGSAVFVMDEISWIDAQHYSYDLVAASVIEEDGIYSGYIDRSCIDVKTLDMSPDLLVSKIDEMVQDENFYYTDWNDFNIVINSIPDDYDLWENLSDRGRQALLAFTCRLQSNTYIPGRRICGDIAYEWMVEYGNPSSINISDYTARLPDRAPEKLQAKDVSLALIGEKGAPEYHLILAIRKEGDIWKENNLNSYSFYDPTNDMFLDFDIGHFDGVKYSIKEDADVYILDSISIAAGTGILSYVGYSHHFSIQSPESWLHHPAGEITY